MQQIDGADDIYGCSASGVAFRLLTEQASTLTVPEKVDTMIGNRMPLTRILDRAEGTWRHQSPHRSVGGPATGRCRTRVRVLAAFRAGVSRLKQLAKLDHDQGDYAEIAYPLPRLVCTVLRQSTPD